MTSCAVFFGLSFMSSGIWNTNDNSLLNSKTINWWIVTLDVKRYSSPEQVTSELRGVTCHMRSHSIISYYYPDTSEHTPLQPLPNRLVLDLPNLEVNMCVVPPTHNIFGDRSFGAASPRIWNSLPCGLRTLDISYKHFKTLLKTYMFD